MDGTKVDDEAETADSGESGGESTEEDNWWDESTSSTDEDEDPEEREERRASRNVARHASPCPSPIASQKRLRWDTPHPTTLTLKNHQSMTDPYFYASEAPMPSSFAGGKPNIEGRLRGEKKKPCRRSVWRRR